MNDSELVAFIFARGGSKGLKNKNIKLFNGKPLIAWTIELIKSIPEIKDLIVSTDSKEIAEVALNFGAKVPFIRPAYLSEDNSPEWDAWQHGLLAYKDIYGYIPKKFISVPTTSPLRIYQDIKNVIKKFDTDLFDTVITVTESHRNPYFNMVKLDSKGNASIVIEGKKKFLRRQEAPPIFDITTVAYMTTSDFILKNKSIYDGTVGAVFIPFERSIDIDSEYDFRIAEFLMRDADGLYK